MKTKDIDPKIEKLYNATICINNIYKNLKEAKNKNEFTKYLDYLKMINEIENNAYKDIGKITLKDEQFLRRLEYLIYKKDIPNDQKTEIINRIEIYYANNFFLNPFLSDANLFEERLNENILAIKSQFTFDYLLRELINFDIEIEKTEDEDIKKILLTQKLNLLFQYKLFEKYLFQDIKELTPTGKNRCIVFNQDELTVNNIYYETASESAYASINNIFSFDNESLNSKEKIAYLKLQFITLKSSLDLYEENEFEIFINNYNELLNIVDKEEFSITISLLNNTLRKYKTYFQNKTKEKTIKK